MATTIEAPEKLLTIEEYLEQEEKALEKHEYRNGKLKTMAGSTPDHSTIALNIMSAIIFVLKSKASKNRIFNSDLRIFIPGKNQYLYPDGAVAGESLDYYPNKKGGITNPLLIVEVLSEGTESYDRGEKFEKYKTLESFREYVLISQHEPKIEVFYRQSGSGKSRLSKAWMALLNCNLSVAKSNWRMFSPELILMK